MERSSAGCPTEAAPCRLNAINITGALFVDDLCTALDSAQCWNSFGFSSSQIRQRRRRASNDDYCHELTPSCRCAVWFLLRFLAGFSDRQTTFPVCRHAAISDFKRLWCVCSPANSAQFLASTSRAFRTYSVWSCSFVWSGLPALLDGWKLSASFLCVAAVLVVISYSLLWRLQQRVLFIALFTSIMMRCRRHYVMYGCVNLWYVDVSICVVCVCCRVLFFEPWLCSCKQCLVTNSFESCRRL